MGRFPPVATDRTVQRWRSASGARVATTFSPVATPGSSKRVHQLKVVLRGVRPPIWRRLQVPSGMTLAELHRVVQVAMGWADYHLHQFEIGGVTYGVDDGEGWGPAPEDEGHTRLDRVAGKGTRFTYEYDFGDGWEHVVTVEDVLDAEAGARYPVCTAGKRACPPEDCGGVWGYEAFLAAVADPDHEEHEDLLEWAGGQFDPEYLDLVAVNRALASAGRRTVSRS